MSEFECFIKYPPMKDQPAVADKVLMEFVEVTHELNVAFHLELGVCLGFMREGGYLPYDNDIDLVVHCDDDEVWLQLVDALRKRGFTLPDNNYGAHTIKDGVMLDVGRVDDTSTQFDVIIYNGVEFNVPHPVEEYLASVYGKDWMFPKKFKVYADYATYRKERKLELDKKRVISEEAKVGYAFVVADLLHIGHMKFLETCREHCDWLIVGVLTDNAVTRYKRTPIIPFRERKQLVEALSCVDYVVTQRSRDPTNTMKRLVAEGFNLALLFHGNDWADVPGTKYITKQGGKLVRTRYYKKQTTTKILEKIKHV